MKRKKGLFFTIDAIMAASIFLVVILLVSNTYISEPDKTHISYISHDTIRVFTNLEINELDNDYIKSLIDDGTITKLNNTFLEQIGELWAEDKMELVENLTRNITDNLIPSQFGFGIYVNGDEIYSRSKSITRNLISSRKIISGIEKDKPREGYTSKVILNGIKSKTTSAYTYFGGYVGDGNLTKKIILPTDIIDILNSSLEVETGGNFDLYINDIFSGSYSKGSAGGGIMLADKFTINEIYFNNFQNGTNTFTINFTSGIDYISGGFLKVRYTTSKINDTIEKEKKTFWFPGIDGVINYYSSIYVPGTLNNMNAHLEFFNNYSIFLRIGNTTVYENITNGSTIIDLDNSTLSGLFSSNSVLYDDLNLTTIPIRLGIQDFSIVQNGNADIIIITDVSGSMDWRLDSDGINGVVRNCNDPNLLNPDTQRLSLAICLDKQFIDVVLNTSLGNTTNRVGLVSYSGLPNWIPTANSDVIFSTHDLSADNASLKNEIDAYNAAGATGICGAIRQARLILEQQSNESRKKFIIVMADGLANVECDDTDVNETKGCISRECPTTGFCSGSSCLYRVAERVGANSRSHPSLGYDIDGNNRWNIISGENDGTFTGYFWNETKWQTNSGLVSGLGDVGSESAPALAFNLTGNSDWTLIAGENSGTFNGYYWDGAQWVSDGSRVSGLGDVGSDSAPAMVFNLTGNDGWTLIAGENSGTFNGYYWDGAQWVSDGSRVSGLGDVGSESAPVLAFNITGSDGFYLISGLSNGRYYSFIWDNNNWIAVCRDFVSNRAFAQTETDACKAATESDAVIYSIGFGPVSNCPIAKSGLEEIATCGNGNYYASSDPDELKNIYNDIADTILSLTFEAQTTNVSGDVFTSLSPDSFIQVNYTPISEFEFGKIPLTFETSRFGNNVTTGSFIIPGNTTVFDAKITSYSSNTWTDKLVLNNNAAFNLSDFGPDYTLLGDPYFVYAPTNMINAGNNTVLISTGITPINNTGGSPDDRAIFTLLVNAFTEFSNVVDKSEGCSWILRFEDNSTTTLSIPDSYSGSDTCYFENASYEQDDSIDIATYNLIKNLDVGGNGLVDIKLDEGNFGIETLTIENVPSLWGPAIIEVRVWE